MNGTGKIAVVLIVGLLIGGGIGYIAFQQQIGSLQAENSDLNDQIGSLESEIGSLESEIDRLKVEREISATQEPGGTVNWILPGLRELDPEIFGTPDMPLGFEEDIGVPLSMRLTNVNGTEYTTTSVPTPFSDNFQPVTGSFTTQMTDRTPIDTMDSLDTAEGVFNFTDPTGSKEYGVVLKMIIPVGPDHPFLGGVIISDYLHGKTMIGTRLMPTMYNYGAYWGVAALYINGELVSANRIVHLMITEDVRDENYKLMIDSELPHTGVHTHLLLPNLVATPQGPQEEPVPTGFILPNQVEQPFLHIMFEDTELEGIEILD